MDYRPSRCGCEAGPGGLDRSTEDLAGHRRGVAFSESEVPQEVGYGVALCPAEVGVRHPPVRSLRYSSSAAIAFGMAGLIQRSAVSSDPLAVHVEVAAEDRGVPLVDLEEDHRLSGIEAVVVARLVLLALVLRDRPLVGPVGDQPHAGARRPRPRSAGPSRRAWTRRCAARSSGACATPADRATIATMKSDGDLETLGPLDHVGDGRVDEDRRSSRRTARARGTCPSASVTAKRRPRSSGPARRSHRRRPARRRRRRRSTVTTNAMRGEAPAPAGAWRAPTPAPSRRAAGSAAPG